MVTGAGVTIDRAKATLRQAEQALMLVATGLDGASWEVYPTDPPPGEHDAANPGTRMIGFTVRLAPDERRTLRVECRLASASPRPKDGVIRDPGFGGSGRVPAVSDQ